MLALNCRRALVTEVGKMGWDAIPHEDRDGVTPAKDASDGYRRYLLDILSSMRTRDADYAESPEFARFVRAQQTWDRAFARAIADALSRPNPPLVVGIIGRGHLEYGYGTPYQLADLGIRGTAILLPAVKAGIADAVFRLDTNDVVTS